MFNPPYTQLLNCTQIYTDVTLGHVVAFEAETIPGALSLRVPPTMARESLDLIDDDTQARHPEHEPAIQADFHRHRSADDER